jgi:hypothetical protein
MEPLWSPVVATDGNWSGMALRSKRPEPAKTVAVGCDPLPREVHGKQGVRRGLPPVAGGPPCEGGVDAYLARLRACFFVQSGHGHWPQPVHGLRIVAR